MVIKHVSAMDLRRGIGALLARVRYAGESFVIEKNGEPVAALISIEELIRLQGTKKPEQEVIAERIDALEAALEVARTIRAQVLARHGGVPFSDVTEEIRQMREDRSNYLADMHR